jgi:hypothetical protein
MEKMAATARHVMVSRREKSENINASGVYYRQKFSHSNTDGPWRKELFGL